MHNIILAVGIGFCVLGVVLLMFCKSIGQAVEVQFRRLLEKVYFFQVPEDLPGWFFPLLVAIAGVTEIGTGVMILVFGVMQPPTG